MGLIQKAMSASANGVSRFSNKMIPLGIAGGAVAGGIIGAASSDSNLDTRVVQSGLAGAVGGAALGGIAAYVPGGIARQGSLLRGAASGITRGAGKAAWGAGKAAGRFIWRHPIMALGAGIGLGVAATMGGSGILPISVNQMAENAVNSGVSSTGYDPGYGGTIEQGAHQQFINSTDGLVQGMHRSRHG